MINKRTSFHTRLRINRCLKSIIKRDQRFFFIIPTIFSFIFYLICYLSSQYHHIYFQSYYLTDKEISDPNQKLLIGVVTVPNSKRFADFINLNRFRYLNDHFISGTIFSRLNSTKYPNFINLDDTIDLRNYLSTLPLIKKSWNDRDLFWVNMQMQFDLIFKLISFLRYFINNSTANWLVRYCDDVFLNRHMIPDLLRYLNSKYDPTQDFYVGGACIDYIKEPILQGGSGYIISKYAAKLILSNAMDFLRDISYYEDWEFSRLLPKIGFPVCNGTNPFFIGHSAKPFSKWMSKLGFTSLFPKCPANLPKLDSCQRVMPRMRDIVFFHDQHQVFSIRDIYHFLNYIPDNLYWYQNGESASLCFKES